MPDYPYCHYLLFAEKDGQYTFLKEQMINDGGPGTPFFEAEMLWLAADAGLTSLTDSTDDQLLEQLYDGKGGRFLSQMGELSTEEQTAIYRRLREYQQTCGDSQAQSLYIEAVQTMQWVRNFYDDAQRAAYELFLAESVRGDEAAAAAQEIMDAMTAEGTITLEYQNNGKRSTRTLDPAGEPTPARAAAFSGSFFWTETQPVEIGNLPEPELTLTSRNGDVIITVWNSAPQVYCVYQGETRAFLAASTSADSFDGNQPFTYLRKWYDKAE